MAPTLSGSETSRPHDLRVRPNMSPPSRPASGRTALVTGANRGIGLAIACGLADLGYRVVLTARLVSDAEAAVRGAGARAGALIAVQMDVTDAESIEKARHRITRDFGGLDALVNNAGVDYDTDLPPSGSDLERASHTLDVNVLGAWRCGTAKPRTARSAMLRVCLNCSGCWPRPSWPGLARTGTLCSRTCSCGTNSRS
jgi:NAD(P)-dependent dehydrogenase (short-subunit alcohol dehydrogenase family)